MNIFDFIYLFICGLGVVNSLIFSGYIVFFSKKNKLADRFLALLLLAFSLRIAKQILVYFNQEIHSSYHIIWFFCLTITAPLLYFTVKYLLSKEQRFRIIILAHFIPSILLTLCAIIYSNEMLIYYGILAQIFIYIVISLLSVFRFKRSKTLQSFDNVRLALIVLLFVSGAFVIHVIANVFRFPFFNVEAFYFSLVLYVIVLVRLSFHKQNTRRLISNPKAILLSDSELHSYKTRVTNYFEENRPFLNPNITLPQIAKELNISHHLLSKVINDAFKLNYNDFVNSFRVDYAKDLLRKSEFENYKISIIAEESGFNSISAFNASFKKFTNTTPSKFRDLE